jgi:hypothetical protein
MSAVLADVTMPLVVEAYSAVRNAAGPRPIGGGLAAAAA